MIPCCVRTSLDPAIEAMFDDPEIEFALVGAAHLVGVDGIAELLRARGYAVSKL